VEKMIVYGRDIDMSLLETIEDRHELVLRHHEIARHHGPWASPQKGNPASEREGWKHLHVANRDVQIAAGEAIPPDPAGLVESASTESAVDGGPTSGGHPGLSRSRPGNREHACGNR
jgi:hypothetical protein